MAIEYLRILQKVTSVNLLHTGSASSQPDPSSKHWRFDSPVSVYPMSQPYNTVELALVISICPNAGVTGTLHSAKQWFDFMASKIILL